MCQMNWHIHFKPKGGVTGAGGCFKTQCMEVPSTMAPMHGHWRMRQFSWRTHLSIIIFLIFIVYLINNEI